LFISIGIALVFTTAIAASGIAREPGYWMLAAAVCWTIALHAIVSHLDQLQDNKKLYYLILANTREFACIASLVLSAYTIGAICVTLLPLNSITLAELKAWDVRVESTHEALKAVALSKGQLILISLLFWSLRFIERYY